MGTLLRIVVVSDSDQDVAQLADYIRSGGYEVVCKRVDSPAALSNLLTNGVVDIVFITYQPDVYDISALVQLVHQQNGELPIFLCSETYQEDIAVESIKLDVTVYIAINRLPDILPCFERILNRIRRADFCDAQFLLQERYRMVVENSLEAIAVTDLEGKLLLINKQMGNVLGYDSSEEIIGKNLLEFIVPEDRQLALDRIRLVLANERLKAVQLRVVRKDKKLIFLETNAAVISDNNGMPLGFMGMARDITESRRIENDNRRLNEILQEKILMNAVERDAARSKLQAEIVENKKLAALTNRLNEILEATSDIVGMSDMDEHGVYLNVSGRKLINIGPDEDICRFTISDFHPAEAYRRIIKEAVPYAIQHGIWSGEPVIRSWEGKTIPASEVIIIHRHEDGSPAYISSIIRDISERVDTERILRESQRRYQVLSEAAHDMIILIDANDQIQYVNKYAASKVGYKQEEIVGKQRNEFFPSGVNDRMKKNLDRVFQSKEALYVEDSIPFSGYLVWGGTWINPIIDDDGEVRTVLVLTRDITEQKRVEEALIKSEETLRTILELLPDIVSIHDKDGKILYISPSVQRFHGYSVSEMIGKNTMDLIHPEDRRRFIRTYIKLFTNPGGIYSEQYRYRNIDGSYTWMEAVAINRLENPVISGIVAVSRDISERKRVEEELQNALKKEKELRRLRSQFVSMTSHEFRTPLSTILSSAELLEHYGHKWSPEKKLDHIHRIREAALLMTTILDNILILGKSEAGRLELRPEELDLIQFCQELVEEIETVNRCGHRIRYMPAESCLIVLADVYYLRQIITNLLSNALKYSPANSPILFGLECVDDKIIFNITDYGIGIPHEDLDMLYAPFFRARNVGDISGHGLGLAVVKTAVDIYGGTIDVKSRLGEGTSFKIALPLLPCDKEIE